MKVPLNLIKLDQISILQQLQWEEALLRADNQNWCLVNRGSSPAIILGISGNPALLIDKKKMAENRVPVIRRFSGGGAIISDENTLFITFICQSSAFNIPSYPKYLMEWSAQFYRPLFNADAFQVRENDYVIEKSKWGGNAQAIVKDRWLHHSSLIWDYSSDLMNYLLMPPAMPVYRGYRKHEDFLCCLCDYWEKMEGFENALLEQLKSCFKITEVSQKELAQIAERPHRKTTQVVAFE